MHRSIASLRSAARTLKFVIEEAVPPGPGRDEAVAMVRDAYLLGRDAIREEARTVDRIALRYAEEEAAALLRGEATEGWEWRLVFDETVGDRSPVVRGTWITAGHVVSLIVEGWTWGDILRTHPELTEDDIRACLAYTTLHETDREAA
jgi:uncharacterized protein (DUF433 family)